jgi:outer membrane protein OmpA-like peptidoglycan-associated protein
MLTASGAYAQAVTGPYVGLGAGVSLQQNEIVAPAPTLNFENKIIYTFHPGFAGQASAGYGLGNGLRAEIEGDYVSNVVRGAQGLTDLGANDPRRAGGIEKKYGGFLNVIYDVSLGLPVTPYFGVGAGGQLVEHNGFNQGVEGVVAAGRVLPAGSPPVGFHDQTVGGFAYQGIAGLSLPISFVPGLSFTADYRFVGLLDPLPAFQLNQVKRVEVTTGDVTSPRNVVVTGNRHFSNDFSHEVMLGFRYALFQPTPPLPAAAVSATTPAPPAEPARTYLVFFDWDRADLTARARQIVAEAAQASTHVQTTRIEVNGYTDRSGTQAYNQRLSVRRAQSVEAELVRDGVNRSEIGIHGFGESNPLVQTAAGVREPQNRRVEIILRS